MPSRSNARSIVARLWPSAVKATFLASRSARFSASGVLTSARGAPSRVPTPTPLRATFTGESAAIFPCLIRSSTIAGVRIATSNGCALFDLRLQSEPTC